MEKNSSKLSSKPRKQSSGRSVEGPGSACHLTSRREDDQDKHSLQDRNPDNDTADEFQPNDDDSDDDEMLLSDDESGSTSRKERAQGHQADNLFADVEVAAPKAITKGGGKAKKREAKQAEEKALTQAQARLFIAMNGTESPKGYTLFRYLGCEEDFSDLRSLLMAYTSTYGVFKKRAGQRVPLEALVTLAMNDYLCANRLAGRMRHSWGYEHQNAESISFIYFAAREWSEREREDYRRLTPMQRLRATFGPMPVQWNSAETSTLKLRTPMFMENRMKDHPEAYRVSLHFAGTSMEDVEAKCGDEILLFWFLGRFIHLTVRDLLKCQRLRGHAPKKNSPPLIRQDKNKRFSQSGRIVVTWYWDDTSPQCQEWAETRALSGAGTALEAALYGKLFEDAIGGDGSSPLTQAWGPIFDDRFAGR